MRLKQNELKTLDVYAKELVPSDYVGEKIELVKVGVIKANVQGVSDTVSAEVYGPRIAKIRRVLTNDSFDIANALMIDSKLYRVVACSKGCDTTILDCEEENYETDL